MRTYRRSFKIAHAGVLLSTLVLSACAGLQNLLNIESPRFELVTDRESGLTIDPISVLTDEPFVVLRVWARVINPNSFGLTLSRLEGDVFLEGREMAEVDLPFGLPLQAARDTIIPVELRFGIPSLSSLGGLGQALLARRPVRYRLDGVIGVDAGALGEPTFGPRTWLQGEVDVRARLGF
jgi:LEA14-like dessication related protein